MLRKQDPNYRDRHIRKIEKFSDRFNEIFRFFLLGYRKGLFRFSGDNVEVLFDPQGHSSRETFRRYDDGHYKLTSISSRQNNVVHAVINGKKGWGLWLDQWSLGIAEGTFTKHEIMEEFERHGLKIPEPLMRDFENRIWRRRFEYLERHRL